MLLLDAPHHDGSPLYLDDEAPRLGAHVPVRVRTDPGAGVDAVWVRTVEDAEPFFAGLARCDPPRGGDPAADWWAGTVHVRNPVQRYRFLVVTGDTFCWLNAAGSWTHDVPDSQDFTLSTYAGAPDWGRDGVVYQIFPDRFARSARADARETPAWAVPARWDDPPAHVGDEAALQLYGGDLDGIVEHLDHVAAVGADIVYLTPVFPAESNHRYNASTFDRVDPLLGGDPAYRRLIDAAHAQGWHVLGDLTSNHTGDTHAWFRTARTDPSSAERGFYYFADDGGYEGWKGHPTLPKLDHRSAPLAERFHAVVARWLDFGLDGWRIDVANMTGRHVELDLARDVARSIRATAVRRKAAALVLAEHGHDATGDLLGDGWHGTMNYYGFSFPVWEWLHRTDRPVPSFGLPVDLPRRTGPEAVAAMRAFTASFGWRAVCQSWNILGSHDSPRIRTVTGTAEAHHAAAVLQFTLPGVPMVFAGDELGHEGEDGEASRTTLDWDRQAEWDTTTLRVYRRLADLRRAHLALRRGGLRWAVVEDDELWYLREHPRETLLVGVNRTGALGEPPADLGAPLGADLDADPLLDLPGWATVRRL